MAPSAAWIAGESALSACAAACDPLMLSISRAAARSTPAGRSRMQRARRAATTALALVTVLCLSSGPATALPLSATFAQAASVVWPPSTLVLSEVQTGGASASDEFVEVANQGAGPVDLIGLEVVYATSSGSTVTRKATWGISTIVEPGRRILIVNGAGSVVAMGDAT